MNKSEPIPGIKCPHCDGVVIISGLTMMSLEDTIMCLLKSSEWALETHRIQQILNNSSPKTITNTLALMKRRGLIKQPKHGEWTNA